MEKLGLKDFDILGIITLKDVKEIEKYVTEIPRDENGVSEGYLSRSKEYYNVKNMTELACEREELRTLLTKDFSKRNFVIIENMLNCSGKVYFTKFEEYILSGKTETARIQLEQAEKCLLEDVKNILVILEGKGEIAINLNNRLPSGMENCAQRAIEMDNKAILYLFAKAIKNNRNPEKMEVITPGYGSIYIGPFLKAMYGYNYTNVFKSKYIQETTFLHEDDKSMKKLMSSERPYEEGKTILLLDDNIGTGATMKELRGKLEEEGITHIFSGAMQYNWRNYYRVGAGEKEDIERFEINDFDFVTPINYPGHKLYKRAIASLIASGKSYIEYLQSKNYRLKDSECDLEGAIYRGIFCAKAAGLQLGEEEEVPNRILKKQGEILPQYEIQDSKVSNPTALITIAEIRRMVKKLIRLEDKPDQSDQIDNPEQPDQTDNNQNSRED